MSDRLTGQGGHDQQHQRAAAALSGDSLDRGIRGLQAQCDQKTKY
jgi:hypothetical protein